MTDEQRTDLAGGQGVLEPSPIAEHEAPMDDGGAAMGDDAQEMPARNVDEPPQQAPGAYTEEPAP